MSPAPDVSIVVSTRNRASMLPALFDAIAAQELDGTFELVIADNGSTDDTPRVLSSLAEAAPFRVVVVTPPNPEGPATGRNAAASAATGEILAFTDDDCRPEPGWLSAGLRAMSDGHHVVVGLVTPPEGKRRLNEHALWVRHWRFFECANTFYRRADVMAVGGFDTTYRGVGGEDTDLALRVCQLGASPRFEPGAHVIHPLRIIEGRAALREAARWHDIPLFYKRHPEQRRLQLRWTWVWRPAHAWWLLGAGTLVAARFRPLGLLGYVPWFLTRVVRPGRRLENVRHAPLLFAVDAVEVATMARGSWRHRTFLL